MVVDPPASILTRKGRRDRHAFVIASKDSGCVPIQLAIEKEHYKNKGAKRSCPPPIQASAPPIASSIS
ncbi:MAG TPA: hypothetical protein VHO91_06415, partial [Rhodopila sp.]|nr:hypothetical protein [Rhodopila sp.]